MIITKNFVLINFPKNGSSYLRSMLKRIHGINNKDLISRIHNKFQSIGVPTKGIRELRLIQTHSIYQENNNLKAQHATYSQIPEKHRKKKVLIPIRDPLERFVSIYEYHYWKKFGLFVNNPEVKKEFPKFPNLDFKEYFEFARKYEKMDMVKDINKLKVGIGINSLQFLRFVLPDPDSYITSLTQHIIEEGNIRNAIPENIEFIHTENLKDEFISFLLRNGYKEKNIIKHFQDSKPINSNKQNWSKKDARSYFTDEMLEKFYSEEAIIYTIFPEYLRQ